MATVRKVRKPSGTVIYQAIWREARRQRTRNFSRAAEARAFAQQMEQEAERRGIGDPEQHTVERFLRRWIATLKDRNEHSPATISGYERCIGMASREIGDVPLARLTARHLDQAYSRMRKHGGCSTSQARHGR